MDLNSSIMFTVNKGDDDRVCVAVCISFAANGLLNYVLGWHLARLS